MGYIMGAWCNGSTKDSKPFSVGSIPTTSAKYKLLPLFIGWFFNTKNQRSDFMFKLTEKQQEIVDSNARVKLIMGGMRSGKTITLIACVEKAMRGLNSRGTQVLIHVPNSKHARMMVREIPYRISRDILIDVNKESFIISTTYGVVEIQTFDDFIINGSFDIPEIEKELLKFDIIAIDNSTSSSLFETIINAPCNDIIAVGHCPEDENNAFYKSWTFAHFDIVDTEAFKMGTWDNPSMVDKKEEHEPNLIKSMELERYIRDYYATII